MGAKQGSEKPAGVDPFGWLGPWGEAWLDAWQRSVLFLDVLRRRGNQHLEHMAKPAPHVLTFEGELVVDGRKLARPVNYGLVAIVPPEGVEIDPNKRPFVVVDPRAGHGPGIGGFKADSEIGVALEAGHPCYFVGFTPAPMPGQTIPDVLDACALFLERVIERHPEAEGRPCVIGNCQAGWMMAMVAALRPELFGPLILAGSPLSYWAGVHGVNPMRYSGGLLGGSWLAELSSDLGAGTFDGAHLVANFESLNPANTLWTKQYNLWSKIDTEAPRYLGFERWWGGHVLLNAEEIRFIVEELFIGNRLATAEILLPDERRIDLAAIRSPILCFCSKGDDITPPQQALGWITDRYGSEQEIVAAGQTIVYAIHESIGHLGIFVSGKVAAKEHREFASNIDLVDCLPPGLYEAVMIPKNASTANPELAQGDYVVRFERRGLADIRALGGNDAEDERRFAAVARLSQVNTALYRRFLQPLVRATANAETAAALRDLHPARLPYTLFSDLNPFLRPVAELAERVRAERRPAAPDNPVVAAREQVAKAIGESLETWGRLRDAMMEAGFHAIYGSPLVQALAGLDVSETVLRPRPGRGPAEAARIARRIEELRGRIAEGGLREAVIRAVVWVGMAERVADERAFESIRRIRAALPEAVPLAAFKAALREQFLMLLIDEEAAVAAIGELVSRSDASDRAAAMEIVRRIATAPGEPEGEKAERLARIEVLFGAAGDAAPRVRRAQGGKR